MNVTLWSAVQEKKNYYGQVTRSTPELALNGIFGDMVRTHRRRDFGPTDFTSTSVPMHSGDPVIFNINFSAIHFSAPVYRQAEDRSRDLLDKKPIL